MAAFVERGLAVDGLAKRFGRKTALEDVSFRAAHGEIVALIGPNGAGKSTTFGALAGLIRPDAGTMRFDGVELGSNRGSIVSLIPETPEVYPLLTVWEHLVFTARLCRLDGDWQTRGRTLLERLRMWNERDSLGNTLSKGMKQKTLIASIVLGGAPVLLLDEPMIGLDPLGQRELRDILADLRAAGTAIVLSTHQLEAAQALCDRVVIVKAGRTVATGTVEEIEALGAGSLEDVFLEITGTA